MEIGAKNCAQGLYSSVVTLPISKKWMMKVGFQYPGHTEFFADQWGGEPVMAFVGDQMKVLLATWHIPFCEVPNALTPELLQRTVEAANELCSAYANDGSEQIAVCGLNPHAGRMGF